MLSRSAPHTWPTQLKLGLSLNINWMFVHIYLFSINHNVSNNQKLTHQFIRTYIHFLDLPHFNNKKYTLFHVITKAEKTDSYIDLVIVWQTKRVIIQVIFWYPVLFWFLIAQIISNCLNLFPNSYQITWGQLAQIWLRPILFKQGCKQVWILWYIF